MLIPARTAPARMAFHPSQVPVARVFDLVDTAGAEKAAAEMIDLGFDGRDDGFKVLMPKDRRLAKRIGHTVTTSVNYGLGRAGKDRNVRFWTYHEDDDHYAIVLVGAAAAERLGAA